MGDLLLLPLREGVVPRLGVFRLRGGFFKRLLMAAVDFGLPPRRGRVRLRLLGVAVRLLFFELLPLARDFFLTFLLGLGGVPVDLVLALLRLESFFSRFLVGLQGFVVALVPGRCTARALHCARALEALLLRRRERTLDGRPRSRRNRPRRQRLRLSLRLRLRLRLRLILRRRLRHTWRV